MRKVLLLTTALVCVTVEPAQAGPVVVGFAQGVFAGLTGATTLAGTAGTAAAIAAGYSFATSVAGGIILRLGAGLLLTALAASALRVPEQPEQKAELAQIADEQPYRYVYGHVEAPGSLVARKVFGRRVYGCVLLNSRPSDGGNLSMRIDKRPATILAPGERVNSDSTTTQYTYVSADIFDFAGDGAVVRPRPFTQFEDSDDREDFLRVWIGLGDQTAPPALIQTQTSGHFSATDAWQGRTVLWFRADAGKDERRRLTRFKGQIPVFDVTMDWSKLWDPNDGAQSATDPATWTYSANQGRVALDVLHYNPVRRYPLAQIDMASILNAISVADETVTRAFGPASEPRYECHGVITWTGRELMDQLKPVEAAGGGTFFRSPDRVGYAAAAWRAPIATITDIFEDGGIEHQNMASDDAVPSTLRGTYSAPERDYERTSLPPVTVSNAPPAAGDAGERELALTMVTSPGQAQRIVKIEAERLARQRRVSFVVPANPAYNLTPGANFTVAMPTGSGFEAALDGTYQATAVDPGVFLADGEGQGGVAFRVALSGSEEAQAIYAWDHTTDEVEITHEGYSYADAVIAAPTALSVTVQETDSGGAISYRLQITATASTDETVARYEVQMRQYGAGLGVEQDWIALGDIDAATVEASGGLLAYSPTIQFGTEYQARVRAVTPVGFSAWVSSAAVNVGLTLQAVAAVTAGLGGLTVAGTSSAQGIMANVRLMRAATGAGLGAAVEVGAPVGVVPNAPFSAVFGTAGATDLVVNGDFAAATDWAGANWTISGGVATHTPGNAAGLKQAIALTAGAVYRVSITVSGLTAGQITLRLDGDTNAESAAITTNGQHVVTLTAPANPTDLTIKPSSSFDGSVDDAIMFAASASDLTQGEADFWAVPHTTSGAAGTAEGPYTRTII